MFQRSSFSLKSFAQKAWRSVVQFASLGAWGPASKEKAKRKRATATIEEALPPAVVTRLREQMLAAALTADVRARAQARVKQQRHNEVALLLMI